jgi:NAD(P)-dependent dehydrogenase (short-subunit alcohol dehydrogenase family)
VAEGGSVVLTGTNDQRIAALRTEFPDAVVLRDDASAPDTGAALRAALEAGPKLDGLWLNAGYADICGVEEVTADFFDRMMATNVRGPMLQLAALADRLNDGASVVLTSSTSTYEGAAVATVYAATKGALIAVARGWASALAPRAIRVNTVVPGPIETDFRSFMSEQVRTDFEADVLDRVPLSRVGTPQEAAAVALFLLSDDSKYVTASQYFVDGGLTRY